MACIFLPPCHYPLSSHHFVLVDHLFDVFIYAPCFILNCVSDTHSSLPSTPSRLCILSTLELSYIVWRCVSGHQWHLSPTVVNLLFQPGRQYVNGFAVILDIVASLHFSCAVFFACMVPAQKVLWVMPSLLRCERYSCCLGDGRCASTYIQPSDK